MLNKKESFFFSDADIQDTHVINEKKKNFPAAATTTAVTGY